MIPFDGARRIALGTPNRYSGTVSWANRRWNYSNRLLTSSSYRKSINEKNEKEFSFFRKKVWVSRKHMTKIIKNFGKKRDAE
jgi:hypothetical protein